MIRKSKDPENKENWKIKTSVTQILDYIFWNFQVAALQLSGERVQGLLWEEQDRVIFIFHFMLHLWPDMPQQFTRS